LRKRKNHLKNNDFKRKIKKKKKTQIFF